MHNADRIIKGCIFNLDGVLVDTAKYHYIAWRQLANQLGFDFSLQQHETLRGLSRMGSLERLLEWGGNIYMTEAEKLHWGDVKNNWYVSMILEMTPDEVLPGVLDFLTEVRESGCKMTLSSASRSARDVLRTTALAPYFDEVVDGNQSRKHKPNPEGFLMAADAMRLRPVECLVFEDSVPGTVAGIMGQFHVVGIGSPEYLLKAHHVIPGFEGQSFATLLEKMELMLDAALASA
jgi:beta-phosphoglucomutase